MAACLVFLCAFVAHRVWLLAPSSAPEITLPDLAPTEPPFGFKGMAFDTRIIQFSYGAGDYAYTCLHRGRKLAIKESALSPSVSITAAQAGSFSGPILRYPACPSKLAYARIVFHRPLAGDTFLRAGLIRNNYPGTPCTVCETSSVLCRGSLRPSNSGHRTAKHLLEEG